MAAQQNVAPSPAELSKRLEDYIKGVPKAELHVHIEGTLEPAMMFQLAARNDVTLNGTVESHTERRKNFKVSVIIIFLLVFWFIGRVCTTDSIFWCIHCKNIYIIVGFNVLS